MEISQNFVAFSEYMNFKKTFELATKQDFSQSKKQKSFCNAFSYNTKWLVVYVRILFDYSGYSYHADYKSKLRFVTWY